jgi:hypothetical protein
MKTGVITWGKTTPYHGHWIADPGRWFIVLGQSSRQISSLTVRTLSHRIPPNMHSTLNSALSLRWYAFYFYYGFRLPVTGGDA